MSEESSWRLTSPRDETSTAGNALETLTLWGLAVAQPIYDLLSRGMEFLLVHQLQPMDVVILAGVLSLLLPGLLAMVEALERRVSGRSRLHSLSVAALVAIIVLLAVKLPAGLAVPASVTCGLGFAWAAGRWKTVRSFMAILSPAALVFPALFLFRPPVSGLLFAPRVDAGGTSGVLSTTPIVFILLDELPVSSLMDPNRRIDAARYPAFADLASRAHWFRNATSVAEGTTYAVPAILTGRYPDRRRTAHLSEYPENLFTWLGDSYPMNVFESMTRLCPEDLRQATGLEESFGARMRATFEDLTTVYLHRLLPAELTAGLPPVTSTWRDFGSGAPEPVDSETVPEPHRRRGASAQVFERFIDTIRPTNQPVLHFLHVNLPHLPWKYLPSGKEYGPLDAQNRPHGLRGEEWMDDPWATIQGYQRHLLQLVYTDRLLGRLFERLRATGLYDRSLVIVTADHGASFWPGRSRREVTAENRADILAVPLLLKLPFQTEGIISERKVETIDILPTLADVLDSPLPWPVDGQSALDDSRPARPRSVWVDATGHEIIGRVVVEERIDAAGPTLERMHSLFGSAEDPQALFRIGRYRDLVGLEPAGLPVAAGSGLEATLSDARIFESLDPATRYVPARIVGSLVVPPEGGNTVPSKAKASTRVSVRDLAVAVNGKIRAVTESYVDLNDDQMFAAMVPEDSFRAGFNRVEIFEISAGGGVEPHLAVIPIKTAIRFELLLGTSGSAQQIVASDGRSLRVIGDALQGEAVFDGVSFTGWAADVERARAADSVLLFAGRKQISQIRTGDFRRDVAVRFETPALAHAGFSCIVPYAAIDDPDSPDLRFFAILGDIATPLPYRDAWTQP